VPRQKLKSEEGPKKENRKNNGGGQPKAAVGMVFTTVEEDLLLAATERLMRTYYLDSGTLGHYIPEKEDLINYSEFHDLIRITVANSDTILAMGSGTLQAVIKSGNDATIEIPECYWVLKIHTCLISVGKLVHDRFSCMMTRNGCYVVDATGRGIAHVIPVAGVYPL
jgi:hypothetical protein